MPVTDAVIPHALLVEILRRLEELPDTTSLRAALKDCAVAPLDADVKTSFRKMAQKHRKALERLSR